MSNRPAYNLRIQYRDGREQSFETYSGKAIESKFRNVGGAWEGMYKETPYNLRFDKGTKLVLADGTEYDLEEVYLDMREPYDPDRAESKKSDKKPAGKKPADKKRKPVKQDPFA